MPTTIDSMREALDQRVVMNALYETMLCWHAVNNDIYAGKTNQGAYIRRKQLEWMLSRFFNVSRIDMRKMLNDHFYPRGTTDGARNV